MAERNPYTAPEASLSEPGPIARVPFARIAAALAVAFVAVTWASVVVPKLMPNAPVSAGHSLGFTGALFITAFALVIAVGLWLRSAWGWWVGFIAGGYQLLSFMLFFVVVLATDEPIELLTGVSMLVLLAFMVMLLLPPTMRSCMHTPGGATGPG